MDRLRRQPIGVNFLSVEDPIVHDRSRQLVHLIHIHKLRFEFFREIISCLLPLNLIFILCGKNGHGAAYVIVAVYTEAMRCHTRNFLRRRLTRSIPSEEDPWEGIEEDHQDGVYRFMRQFRRSLRPLRLREGDDTEKSWPRILKQAIIMTFISLLVKFYCYLCKQIRDLFV